MSIFLCHSVATRAAFGQNSDTGLSEQDLFEAKGRALSRQARRGRITSNIGLNAALVMKSLGVAPLAFLAAMTVNQALAAAAPQLDMIEAHACSAGTQDMSEIVIAQSGKARTTTDRELAVLPTLVSQQSKVRQEAASTLTVVSYVRCLQGAN